MPKYLLYKTLENLAKILSFGHNIDISLGGYFFAHPVYSKPRNLCADPTHTQISLTNIINHYPHFERYPYEILH